MKKNKINKLIFMGTPEFAVPSLNALIDSGYDVVAVVTQTDKPRGRKNIIMPSPVKAAAEEHGIKVLQYNKIRFEGVDELRAFKPDIMITAAYGQILSQEILDIPAYGVINVHASLLPKYRGAMPVQWAIIKGEKAAGVTIMQTDAGLDTGDMLLQQSIDIGTMDTAGDVLNRLSVLGAELLIKTLEGLEAGEIKPTKQSDSEATYQPILNKKDTGIDWSKSALEINNLIRAMNPAPGAFTTANDEVMKIWTARESVRVVNDAIPAGRVLAADKNGLLIKCGEGVLELCEIQMPNSKRMTAQSYLNGKKLPLDTVLGEIIG